MPELVYKQLRESIFNGSLAPGVLLRQERIAKLLHVSRVPLREAMSRLERDGFIVSRPNRGYAVAELNEQEIVEIFEMRMVLEEHAGAVAARARTEQDIADVEVLMRRMEMIARQSSNYTGEWAHVNRDFHSRLVRSCRRRRLLDMSNTLRESVEAYVRIEMTLTGDVESALLEHRELFAAFKAGDASGMAELSRKHVESTAKRLLSGLRRKSL